MDETTMSPWQKAEAERLDALRRRSVEIMAALETARGVAAKRGALLRIEVDNDCWSVGPTAGSKLSEDEAEELQMELYDIVRGDEGPSTLACLFAIALGFDAGRP